MAMYAPDGWAYYSVETPSVFREVLLPIDDADYTGEHRRAMCELQRIAEQHGTHIVTLARRRG